MANVTDLTVAQLQRAVAIKQQIETLTAELDSLSGNGVSLNGKAARKKSGMSLAGRARIGAAARARWAKHRAAAAGASADADVVKKKRKFSPAARARIGAAAKARWAKAREAGKTTL